MNIPVLPFQSNIPSRNKLSILSNNEIAPRIILIIAVSGSFHGNILIYGWCFPVNRYLPTFCNQGNVICSGYRFFRMFINSDYNIAISVFNFNITCSYRFKNINDPASCLNRYFACCSRFRAYATISRQHSACFINKCTNIDVTLFRFQQHIFHISYSYITAYQNITESGSCFYASLISWYICTNCQSCICRYNNITCFWINCIFYFHICLRTLQGNIFLCYYICTDCQGLIGYCRNIACHWSNCLIHWHRVVRARQRHILLCRYVSINR